MKNVFTKKWWKAAGMRAVKTMAQTFVAVVGTTTMVTEVNWIVVASTTALAGILSVATSIAGIPEAEMPEDTDEHLEAK